MKNQLVCKFPSEYARMFYGMSQLQSPDKTIKSWMRCVEGISENISKKHSKEESLVFKGDSLEILGESFFSVFYADPRVGLVEYSPVSIDDDYGVDAVGVNVVGDKCAVQYKYKANPADKVGWEDLAKTEAYGRRHLGCNTEKPDSVWLVTTSRGGVTPTCSRILGKSLRVINRNVLEDMVDNNDIFWNATWLSIKNYV
jgi:hypothetical protein